MTGQEPRPRGRLSFALIPIAVFVVLAALFWRGLSGDPSALPSALIGRPAPQFDLPGVRELGVPGLATASLTRGGVSVVNVWASWCVPCREEHPLLSELAKRSDIALFGINYKDEPANARNFLATMGQPFAAIGADESGRVGVDWGVYGVPETYVIDGKGIIRFKWIGPLTPEALTGTLAAEIEKAKTPQG
jgi:cytochrome c biogenesis protein CcmG/thiol:disulfide interchange protein DsbE